MNLILAAMLLLSPFDVWSTDASLQTDGYIASVAYGDDTENEKAIWCMEPTNEKVVVAYSLDDDILRLSDKDKTVEWRVRKCYIISPSKPHKQRGNVRLFNVRVDVKGVGNE